MYLSLLFCISLGLLLVIQISYSIDPSQLVYTFQTNKTNSSYVTPNTGQDIQYKDNRTSIFNQPEGYRANPGDLDLKGNTLTPELIAKDLSQKNSSQIAEFPLQEYSKEDIIVVFDNLSVDTLEKVLKNIHQENLKRIFDKFLPFEYEPVLEEVSQQTQDYVIKIIGLQE